jgi:hypothetical protein
MSWSTAWLPCVAPTTSPWTATRATPALFLWRRTSAVLNVLSTGTNHEIHAPHTSTGGGYAKSGGYAKRNTMRVQKVKKNSHYGAKYVDKKPFVPMSVHAEVMAMDKIRQNKSKKIIDVSLLVIRITKKSVATSYQLSNSRPCICCIHKIKNMNCHGYRISKIYYSDDMGNIICSKLRDIVREKHHICKYFRDVAIPKVLLREYEIAESKTTKFIEKNKQFMILQNGK